jgi:acetoin utilization deacetylase AcuC-like enzyme
LAEDLVYFYPEGHAAHYFHGHPERPERIEAVREALGKAGLWDAYSKLAPLALSRVFLSRVHDPHYLAILESACRQGFHLDGDTYTTPASYQLALNACGGAAACAGAVWEGQAKTAFALCRPPGHHAGPGYGMGFCLLNNMAAAAEHVLGLGARRVAVVDLDLHHGNGTQDIFYKRSDVLFISTHQAHFYPGSGRAEERGDGPGLGATANIPLPAWSGDRAFEAAMDKIILPLLERFSPEMVLASIGFDPHYQDPLGQLALSAGGLGRAVAALANYARSSCQGRLALVLEGGYDLEAGGACAVAAVQALLGRNVEDHIGPTDMEGEAWQDALPQISKTLGLTW